MTNIKNTKNSLTLDIGHLPFRRRGGFTLVEMIVAVFIFSIVMIVASTAVITMLDANRKAQATKTVMNNLNFALDSMTRAIRVGTMYTCGAMKECPEGSDEFSFIDSDNRAVTYSFLQPRGSDKGSIERDVGDGSGFLPVTAPDVDIDTFKFYLKSGTNEQPHVLVIIRGTAGKTERTKVSFDLETLITQRFLDRVEQQGQ
jgi:prepilin-type N-terminal cleavage/methylation domain-containing protein